MQFISQLLEHPSLFAYFVGANNYTWLHFRNGERRLLAKPLAYFEERLPAFVRIHKTALINPVCVVQMLPPPRAKMSGTIQMQDGAELPVSRRRWQEVILLLQERESASSASNSSLRTEPVPAQPASYTDSRLVVLAVMTPDALMLTRERIDALGLSCVLQHVELGAELATSLLLHAEATQPALILLDARTHRVDRILTLRALKGHSQLRSIPVVWLAAPGDDVMQVYALKANSVVEVPNDSMSFLQVIEQLCRYWLRVVQLPDEVNS